jgi:hypothetical protein
VRDPVKRIREKKRRNELRLEIKTGLASSGTISVLSWECDLRCSNCITYRARA